MVKMLYGLFLWGTGMLWASCSQRTFLPENGDLLFCVAEASAMSEAIVDATKTEARLQFDHVALFALVDGEEKVIEASSKQGVVCRSWSDFAAEAAHGFVVMRVRNQAVVPEAIRRALSFVGQPYDWSFLPDNGRLYCSELIYESFLQRDGSPLFTAQPMRFRRSDGVMPPFWEKLFAAMGEPIPEGVPGTNPNDMAREKVLDFVKAVGVKTGKGAFSPGMP